ncbi:MAG: hypothetical protein PSN04_02110 [Methyloprofundus sp.]|nr:hypothetical protein [Methyloprofundus sp.]
MISIVVIIVIILFIGGGLWIWPLVASFLGLSSVTDKSSALKHIGQLMNTYDILPVEVESAFHSSNSHSLAVNTRSKGDIAKVLFAYLGAIFILAGMGTYIGMFWDDMGSTMRVLVTLGVGYFLFIVLISALHEGKFSGLILPLTLASAFMMSSGWFVLIHEVYPQLDNWRGAVLFVFSIMALHQGILFSKYRRTVLVFTALCFMYGFLYVAFEMLDVTVAYIAIVLGSSVFLLGSALEKTPYRVLAEPALLIGAGYFNAGLFDRMAAFTSISWASLLTGICVAFTAYGIHKAGRYPRLIAIGYFVGSAMAYGGLFDLIHNTAIELLYLFVTAAVLYICVAIQSRVLLLTTVIAMLSFIGYFSEKYFTNVLGWPVTLILIGIIFLGVGVGAVALKVKERI